MAAAASGRKAERAKEAERLGGYRGDLGEEGRGAGEDWSLSQKFRSRIQDLLQRSQHSLGVVDIRGILDEAMASSQNVSNMCSPQTPAGKLDVSPLPVHDVSSDPSCEDLFPGLHAVA